MTISGSRLSFASVPVAQIPEGIARLSRALERIRGLVLLWGADDSLRALSSLTDILGTRLSRLGASAAVLLGAYGPARLTALARDLALTPSGSRQHDVAADHPALVATVQLD